jgi:hypothetical protein
MADDCVLCVAERVTPWHFEDEQCWVADCLICGTPMVVWRSHGLPDDEIEGVLLDRLSGIAAARYGEGGFWIDGARRRIPDHWHAHARPAGGFFDVDKEQPPWFQPAAEGNP